MAVAIRGDAAIAAVVFGNRRAMPKALAAAVLNIAHEFLLLLGRGGR